MTPLQFEAAHAASWRELEAALTPPARRWRGPRARPADRARIAALYRGACEHLAIAESRSYPVWLIAHLQSLTAQAHQRIYRQSDLGLDKLARLFLVDFPAAVRAHRLHVLVATLVFALPMLVIGVISFLDPGFILLLHDAAGVDGYDRMYGDDEGPIGRRTAASDWTMFGFYILNNIGIAFQCFAGGLFFGLGSLFFLAVNGALAGSVAGYLTYRGHGENFYSFVITHGAFELT
ncbi:MAG: stage II sporulation protein M, partial [Caldimonas sp.]